MPVILKYSKTKSNLFPLFLSPALSNLGGGIYLVLTVAITLITYKAAKIEREADKLAKELFTLEELTAEEAETMIQEREDLLSFRGKYRIVLPILLIVLLVVCMSIVIDLMSIYRNFVGEIVGAQQMVHTPTDWVFVFNPLLTLVIYALYRH